MKISEELENKRFTSSILDNIGLYHYSQSNYPLALEFYQKSLIMAEEIGDKAGICKIYESIGAVYLETNNYDKALNYTLKGLTLANELGLLENQATISGNLS